MAEKFHLFSPYNYGLNNPIIMIDPNGMETKSTHTDKYGNVLVVYNDGDLGVYKHDDANSKRDIDRDRRKNGTTSGSGEKMGETANWDEFVSPETGKTLTDTRSLENLLIPSLLKCIPRRKVWI